MKNLFAEGLCGILNREESLYWPAEPEIPFLLPTLATELEADLLIKATKVEGVYSDDPKKNPQAELFDKISYDDVLSKNLRIMDHSAISLCRENKIPIVVLNIFKKDNLKKAICGEQIGTRIC